MIARRRLLQTTLALSLPATTLSALARQARGRPLNLILVSSGQYDRYLKVLKYFSIELERLGLIAEADFYHIENDYDTLDYWQLLSRFAGGKRLRFLPDGHYSYEFDPSKRPDVLGAVMLRLTQKKDVDLILTFGTDASLDIKKLVKDIPILVLDSSSALKSGIIQSATDSGQDNLHARLDPNVDFRQLNTFRSFVAFQRLGVPLLAGRRSIIDIAQVERFCQKTGIELICEEYEKPKGKPEQNFPIFFNALKKIISRGAEAVYITYFDSTPKQFGQVVRYLIDHRIPSFSQTGSFMVSRGLLMGSGDNILKNYAAFEAWALSEILRGKSPRSLPLSYNPPPSIAVNLRAAALMNLEPSLPLLTVASNTYTTIPYAWTP